MTPEDTKPHDTDAGAPPAATRSNVLIQIDDLVERVNTVRKIFIGMSFSSIVLAPLSILLATFLLLHPSFSRVLDSEDEFGYVLAVFLGIVISISSMWLGTGLRQHQALRSWNKRYTEYLKEKDRVEQAISEQYGILDEDAAE
jgi:hypothetical protein